MARDGSGTYNLPQAAFVSGTTIESGKVNSNFSDVGAALTQSLSKDGQTVPTSNLPMGGFKLTGLGAGSGNGDSVRYEQLTDAIAELDPIRASLLLAARGLLVGCGLSNNAGASTTKIDVADGSFIDDTNAQIFSFSSGTIDCGSTGANGLDSGSLANNTWYHAFAIGKTDGTTAPIASTSISSPTMPSGYTLKRRLGSFKTNGSAQIIAFIQNGDNFRWVAPVTDINQATVGSLSRQTQAITVPTGVIVFPDLIVHLFPGATNSPSMILTSLGEGDTTPSPVSAQQFAFGTNTSNGASVTTLHTNTSAQISYKVNTTDCAVSIQTCGWTDRRGRDA